MAPTPAAAGKAYAYFRSSRPEGELRAALERLKAAPDVLPGMTLSIYTARGGNGIPASIVSACRRKGDDFIIAATQDGANGYDTADGIDSFLRNNARILAARNSTVSYDTGSSSQVFYPR